jgi:hypothetical protein
VACPDAVAVVIVYRGCVGQSDREGLVKIGRRDVCVWQLVGGCQLEVFLGLVLMASGVVRGCLWGDLRE